MESSTGRRDKCSYTQLISFLSVAVPVTFTYLLVKPLVQLFTISHNEYFYMQDSYINRYNRIHFRAMQNYRFQFSSGKIYLWSYHDQNEFDYLIQMNFSSILTRIYWPEGPKLPWHPLQKLCVSDMGLWLQLLKNLGIHFK